MAFIDVSYEMYRELMQIVMDSYKLKLELVSTTRCSDTKRRLLDNLRMNEEQAQEELGRFDEAGRTIDFSTGFPS
mgnify:CR=1 FL=1